MTKQFKLETGVHGVPELNITTIDNHGYENIAEQYAYCRAHHTYKTAWENDLVGTGLTKAMELAKQELGDVSEDELEDYAYDFFCNNEQDTYMFYNVSEVEVRAGEKIDKDPFQTDLINETIEFLLNLKQN